MSNTEYPTWSDDSFDWSADGDTLYVVGCPREVMPEQDYREALARNALVGRSALANHHGALARRGVRTRPVYALR